MITHKQIEAFRSVMTTGSATQAAKVMSISQPAISRLISSLEFELGFHLFIRANRQLIPTYEARMFYDEVEQSFLGLARLKRSAEAIVNERVGRVSLISIPSIASGITVELISQFAKKRPGVGVSLEVQTSQRMLEYIISHECDLGISTLPIDNLATDIHKIATGHAVCIMPVGHRLADKDVIYPEDFEDECFIDHKSNSAFRQFVDEIFLKSFVKRKLIFDARTTDVVVSMVRANLGVAVIEPDFSKTSERVGIVEKPFSPEIPINLSVIASKRKPLSEQAEAFVHITRNYYQASKSLTVSEH